MARNELDSTLPLKERLDLDARRFGYSELNNSQSWMLAIIFTAYVTSVPLRPLIFISAINPHLIEDKSIEYSNIKEGVIVITQELSFAIGKLFTGFLVDDFGEIKMMLIFSFLSTLFVFLCSFASNYYILTIFACLNALGHSGIRPALCKLIYKYFSPKQYHEVLCWMSIGHPLGLLLAQFGLGLLLLHTSWRHSLYYLSLFGLIGTICFAIFGIILYNYENNLEVWYKFPSYHKLMHKYDNHSYQEKSKNLAKKQLNHHFLSKESLINLKNEVEEHILKHFKSQTKKKFFERILGDKRYILISLATGALTLCFEKMEFSELMLYVLFFFIY